MIIDISNKKRGKEKTSTKTQAKNKKKPVLKFKLTQRGFPVARFYDFYGAKCSLQKSSLSTALTGISAVWLGVDIDQNGKEGSRMHLTREQVAMLLPALRYFVKYGELPCS